MIFAATIVTYTQGRKMDAEEAILAFNNIEITYTDENLCKFIIIISANNESDIEEVRSKLIDNNAILEVEHHAFYFGEEVEKVTEGGIVPDIDFENVFKKHS